MYSECLFRISKTTIVREIMGQTYLNELRKHSVAIFTLDAIPLMLFLKDWKSFEEIEDFISKRYECDTSIREYCLSLINGLMQAEMLEVKSKSIRRLPPEKSVQNQSAYQESFNLESLARKRNQLLSVTIELTYLCNLNCKHCFNSNYCDKSLSKDFYFKLLDDLYEMEVLNIVFTGGEVFLRKDAFEIIEYAVRKNFLVDVFTNATLIDEECVNKLCGLNIHSVQSSIYSVSPTKHDCFVGQKGAFDKTIRNLEIFSNTGILTAIKTCIFRFNYNEFNDLKQLAESIGASFQFTFTLLPRKNGRFNLEKFELTKPEMKKFLSLSNEKYCYEKDLTDAICSAGSTSLSINPEGKVFLCNAFDMEIGDLNNESIDNIWHTSKGLNCWRETTMEKLGCCKGCKYSNYCDFCPGTAYKLTGSPFVKYDEACRQAKKIFEVGGANEIT